MAQGNLIILSNANGANNALGYIAPTSVQPAFLNFHDGTLAKTVRNLAVNGTVPAQVGTPAVVVGVPGVSPPYATFGGFPLTGISSGVVDLPGSVNQTFTFMTVARAVTASTANANAVPLIGDVTPSGSTNGNLQLIITGNFYQARIPTQSGLCTLATTGAQQVLWNLLCVTFNVLAAGGSTIVIQNLTTGTTATATNATVMPSTAPGGVLSIGAEPSVTTSYETGTGNRFFDAIWQSVLSSADIALMATAVRARASSFGVTI